MQYLLQPIHTIPDYSQHGILRPIESNPWTVTLKLGNTCKDVMSSTVIIENFTLCIVARAYSSICSPQWPGFVISLYLSSQKSFKIGFQKFIIAISIKIS